jgi:hypothetical protein
LRHFEWAATLEAILEYAGIPGFLSNLEAVDRALGPRYAQLLEVLKDYRDAPPVSCTDWVERLRHSGLEERFIDRHGQPKTARACATLVGSLFSDKLDATFDLDGEVWRLERTFPDGPTHSPVYGFVRRG